MNLFSKAKNLFDGGKTDPLDHVRRGDVDYVRTADQKILLKAIDKYGDTVLLMATKQGNLELCEEILLKKCPSLLYHENNKKKTVHHKPIEFWHENFLLIDFFVTSNEGDIFMKFQWWMKMQDFKGNTAFVIAAYYGNLHVVKRFVEVDCQYNLGLSKVVGDMGKTALDLAVENEDREMLKLLTDEGDPYSDFVPYSTAMDLFDSVKGNVLDYIKNVVLNVLLKSRDKDRMSVLCIATT